MSIPAGFPDGGSALCPPAAPHCDWQPARAAAHISGRTPGRTRDGRCALAELARTAAREPRKARTASLAQFGNELGGEEGRTDAREAHAIRADMQMNNIARAASDTRERQRT